MERSARTHLVFRPHKPSTVKAKVNLENRNIAHGSSQKVPHHGTDDNMAETSNDCIVTRSQSKRMESDEAYKSDMKVMDPEQQTEVITNSDTGYRPILLDGFDLDKEQMDKLKLFGERGSRNGLVFPTRRDRWFKKQMKKRCMRGWEQQHYFGMKTNKIYHKKLHKCFKCPQSVRESKPINDQSDNARSAGKPVDEPGSCEFVKNGNNKGKKKIIKSCYPLSMLYYQFNGRKILVEKVTHCKYCPRPTDHHTPSNKSPLNKSPSNKSPLNKSPLNKSPSSKSPLNKSPSSKSPLNKSPSSKSPLNKSPSSKSPSNKLPSSKSPLNKSPSSKSPSNKLPSSKSPLNKSPSSKSPSNKSPSNKSPSNKTELVFPSLGTAGTSREPPVNSNNINENETSVEFKQVIDEVDDSLIDVVEKAPNSHRKRKNKSKITGIQDQAVTGGSPLANKDSNAAFPTVENIYPKHVYRHCSPEYNQEQSSPVEDKVPTSKGKLSHKERTGVTKLKVTQKRITSQSCAPKTTPTKYVPLSDTTSHLGVRILSDTATPTKRPIHYTPPSASSPISKRRKLVSKSDNGPHEQKTAEIHLQKLKQCEPSQKQHDVTSATTRRLHTTPLSDASLILIASKTKFSLEYLKKRRMYRQQDLAYFGFLQTSKSVHQDEDTQRSESPIPKERDGAASVGVAKMRTCEQQMMEGGSSLITERTSPQCTNPVIQKHDLLRKCKRDNLVVQQHDIATPTKREVATPELNNENKNERTVLSLRQNDRATPTKSHIDTPTKGCVATPTKCHIDTPTKCHIDTPTKSPVATPTQIHIASPTKSHVATPTNIPKQNNVPGKVEKSLEIASSTQNVMATPTNSCTTTPINSPITTPTNNHITANTCMNSQGNNDHLQKFITNDYSLPNDIASIIMKYWLKMAFQR